MTESLNLFLKHIDQFKREIDSEVDFLIKATKNPKLFLTEANVLLDENHVTPVIFDSLDWERKVGEDYLSEQLLEYIAEQIEPYIQEKAIHNFNFRDKYKVIYDRGRNAFSIRRGDLNVCHFYIFSKTFSVPKVLEEKQIEAMYKDKEADYIGNIADMEARIEQLYQLKGNPLSGVRSLKDFRYVIFHPKKIRAGIDNLIRDANKEMNHYQKLVSNLYNQLANKQSINKKNRIANSYFVKFFTELGYKQKE